MKKILFLIILLLFIVSIILYPSMPEQIPTHWNAAGEIDAHSAKWFGMFFLPAMLLFLFVLYLIIPGIEVFKKNLEKSRNQFDSVFLALFLFFVVIYAVTVVASFGYDVKMTYVMMLSMGMLFYWIGHEIKHIKRNFFFGIRTPWALSSDHVWKKT
ncbi:MAG: DUF1648 domain-containing protein, partial [Nanoarchaeota archaeon]|nr:DUF1648 domain-containing protein [Nanoarchaeota archaeon]